MHPLSDCPAETFLRIRAVLCDIDDTLTWEGRLPAVAFAALERLHQAGVIVAPITGRPAGWCDHIARMWPVDGLVGENGAFYFRYDPAERRMLRRYWQGDDERRAGRAGLQRIAARVLAEVPGAAVAADQAYREADLAIDFCEDVAPLGDAAIDRIVAIFEAEGATAKVSSIHVNGWFGDYDKLSMSKRLLHECFALDTAHDDGAVAFVGDSPNDQPMFAFFEQSFGVANIHDFAARLESKPAWVTDSPGGHGFAEFTERLLAARTAARR